MCRTGSKFRFAGKSIYNDARRVGPIFRLCHLLAVARLADQRLLFIPPLFFFMLRSIFFRFSLIIPMAGAVLLSACSPTYDWREVPGTDAPYIASFPAKPATHSRAIDLNGMKVTMTMTAARVDDITFAVGSVPAADAKTALASINAMKTAMVKNIGGTIRGEKMLPPALNQLQVIDVEATGKAAGNNPGQTLTLFARFIAKPDRAYQLIVIGPAQAVPREEVDMFFSSFKAN
jgi:hypothetical protein